MFATPLDRAEMSAIADAAPVMLWRAAVDQSRDFFNEEWLRFTGRSLGQLHGWGWAGLVDPGDLKHCLDISAEALERREKYAARYRLRRHDGEYIWIYEKGQPIYRDGIFAGYVGSCFEDSLLRVESSPTSASAWVHRLNNSLALVQSIAGMTLRGLRPAEQEREAFCGRLVALGKAHEVLAGTSWEPVALQSLVVKLAAAGGVDGRLRLAGPEVRLPPKTALSFALAIHELMTNARHYGAFCVPQGWVEMAWSIGAGDHPLRMSWREHGGPVPATTADPRLGLRMVVRALEDEFSGKVRFDFSGEGFTCYLE